MRSGRPPSLVRALLEGDGPGVHLVQEADPTQVQHVLETPALLHAARGTAARLRQLGLGPRARVALCLPTGDDFLAWFLGALWVGALPVPLPPLAGAPGARAAAERVRAVVADCAPAALVASDAALAHGALPRGGTRVLEAPERGPPQEAGEAVSDARSPLAYLQYTSGSTASPRGVVVTRRNLLANLQGIGAAVAVRATDRVFSWLPLFHDMGLVGALLFSLYWRVPLYLASPRSFVLRPAGWLRALGALGITLSPAPHFAYALCARRLRERELEGLDLRRWRLALDGAEPLRPDTARAFVERFARAGFRPEAYFPVYGMAEATLALTLPRPGEGVRVDRVQRGPLLERGRALPAHPDDAAAAEHVALGRPLAGHHLGVHHPRTGARLGERQVGEVWVRGPSVSPGYFGRPLRAGRTLRTGDLGYLADGQLYLVGRRGDVVILGGANVYPEDLERVAEGVSGVQPGRVVAFGVPAGATGTEAVVVALEVRAPARSAHLRQRLAHALLARCGIAPGDVVLLPPRSLPLTPSGKRMRQRARALYLSGAWASLRHADDSEGES